MSRSRNPAVDFVPIEVSDPGTTSAGLASYRLRASYYGPASPVLNLVSGRDG
ncbi:MAG TPA: hypothetical protein VFG15_04140 [Amycolatopsis sp.]|nr:hypothetical protein [Amycolatopsis sp.]